jgi:hypothetical protein
MPCRFVGPASRRKFRRFRKQGLAVFVAGVIPYLVAPHAIGEEWPAPAAMPAVPTSACVFKAPRGKATGGDP